MADPKVRADRTLGAGAGQGVRRGQGRRSAGAPVPGAGHRPARSAAAARERCSRSTILSLDAGWLGSTAGRRDGETRISTIWALGSSGDAAVVPTLQPLYESPDAGVRKMVVYALGALPGDTQLDDAAHGAAGRSARRALECRGRARAPRQPRRRAGAAADARSRSTSSRRSSATCGRTTIRIRSPTS